jgi:hypothetical protein
MSVVDSKNAFHIIHGFSEFGCRCILAGANSNCGIKSAEFRRGSHGAEGLCDGDISKLRSSNGQMSEIAAQLESLLVTSQSTARK